MSPNTPPVEPTRSPDDSSPGMRLELHGGYAGRSRYTLLEYEAVLSNASIGIAFTRERKFFLCNPRFASMLGWTPAELVGQLGEVIYPGTDSYEAMGAIVVPKLAAGEQVDIEWELRRRDGSTFVARVIANTINPSAPQQGTIWIAEDITERRLAEAELTRVMREQEVILDSASVGIAFIKDRQIVRCNRRYEEMYGYGPGELTGQSTLRLYPDEDDYRDAAPRAYQALRASQVYEQVAQRRTKDGGLFWVRTKARAIDPANPAQGSVWLTEDITEQRRADQEMQDLVLEQQALLNNAVVGITIVRDRKVVRCNRRYEEMFGMDPGAGLSSSTRDIYFTEQEFEQGGRSYDELDRGRVHARDQWLRRHDGSGFWCRMTGRAVEPGEPCKGYVWVFEDITERRRADDSVQRLLREQNALLENAMIGIAFLKDRRVLRCNRRFEELFGYGKGELLNRSMRLLYGREDEFDSGEPYYESIWAGETHVAQWRMVRKDGSEFWCHMSGRAVQPGDPEQGSVWLFEDITAERNAHEELERSRAELERAVAGRTAELSAANARLEAEIAERKSAEDRAQHLADHDALTGLPNRRLLEDRLTQALALSYRNRKQTAVMFIDLDRFKTINDSLGHAAGDLLLKEVALRLVGQLRDGDTVCRVGGDEFVVVLPEIRRGSDAAHVAQKIIDTLQQPIVVEGRDLTVTPSIGISVFPDDGRDAEALIRNADAAMYHAKGMGRSNYQFFTEQMNLAASKRLALENELRRAVQKDDLVLFYQPVTELKTGCVVMHEALLRWPHPTKGMISPADFIQLAEDTGLILKIGESVLRQACTWAARIGVDKRMPVAVNLSARQFNDPGLPDMVARVLKDTGLPAPLLELELTESTVMQQTHVTLQTMERLRELGVSLAIDDFGTGYSSLAYLKRFPVDKLKIDKTFVDDVTTSADDRAIVSVIIGLGHALGLKVVAEGVETEAQLEFLQRAGCDQIQGYLSGRPADSDSAAAEYL